MPTCKWLFLNHLCSKTWKDSESRPPPPDVPIKNPSPLQAKEFAVEHNCRLVLTGDTKQHHSVQRGDALRVLERSGVIAQAVLTKIHRQRIPELRAAIEDLSKGRTTEGFDKLDKFGAIQEIPNDADRLAAIAEKQIDALKAKRSSLIIGPTHGECRAIAGAVRKAMKENGLLSDSEHSVTRLQRLNLTDAQQRDAVTYEPGQVVEFHKIAKGAFWDRSTRKSALTAANSGKSFVGRCTHAGNKSGYYARWRVRSRGE